MNDKLNPIKKFYSNDKNNSSVANTQDEISALISSCIFKNYSFLNYVTDAKLRVLYAEINTIIKNMNNDEYNLSHLIDERILRYIFAGFVLSKESIGARYLIEAVIICKHLFVNQKVIVAGDIYRQVADSFHVSPEAVEKAIRCFTKELWASCKNKSTGLSVYKLIFPSFTSSPTNKETIVYMAIKMLEIEKLLESVAL